MDRELEVDALEPVYKQPKDHTDLKRMVEQYLNMTRENANLCKRDRDYYDGDQLSGAAKAELAKRGQPPVVINQIKGALRGMLGLIDSAATSPEAYPRNEKGQNAADVCTKTLRYLADKANYSNIRRKVSENFLIQGTCAAALEYVDDYIDIRRIRWEDLIYDPLDREDDFSHSKYLGIARMLDAADVEAMYPDTYKALGAPKGDFLDFNDEKSKTRWWSTAKRDMLRVVDLYYEVGGEWHRAIFVDTGMLYAGPSAYHDDYGVSMCPIVAASFETKQNGDRYGVIRDMVWLQDEINSRRSRLLHLVNHRQVQQTDMYAQPAHAAIAKREVSKADGVLPFGYAPIQTQDLAQGQAGLLADSKSDLDRMSPTPALLGRAGSASESGRARQILQQAGGTEMARGFAKFQDWENAIYRKLWLIAKEHLTQPTMIRIMDDPKAIEFLQLNEPIMGLVPKPVIDPMTGQPHMVMQMGIVGMKNRLAELDMDIVLSNVPDAVTLKQEVFDKILEYAASTGISPFDPKFLALIEMSNMPDKQATIDRLKRLTDEQTQQSAEAAQAQAEQAQQAQQVTLGLQAAKAAKDNAHANKATAEAERTTLENQAFVVAAAHHGSQNNPFG